MVHYFYIIESLVDGSYYKGVTQDPLLRLKRHNNGESTYTSRKCPWKLIYIEEMENKSKALQHEKRIKKYNRSKLAELIDSKANIVLRFINPVG